MLVSAPNYKPWFYVNDQSLPTIRLESGEEKILDVELEPKDSVSK